MQTMRTGRVKARCTAAASCVRIVTGPSTKDSLRHALALRPVVHVDGGKQLQHRRQAQAQEEVLKSQLLLVRHVRALMRGQGTRLGGECTSQYKGR